MVKYKKINVMIMIFALLGGATAFQLLRAPDYESNNKLFRAQIIECKKNYTGGVPCFDVIVKEHADKIPLAMMLTTVDDLNKEKALGGKCHEILHAVGVAYYSESIENIPLAKMCGMGLTHGMLQAAAVKGDEEKVAFILNHQCRNGDNVVEPSCTHGMGHDLKLEGFSNNEALKHCEEIMPKKEMNYQVLAFSCLEGFFMQDSMGKKGKKKTGRILFLAMALDPLYSEEERSQHCDNGIDLELRSACKVVLYRFSYPNYFLNPELKNSKEFPADYIQKQCASITKGEILRYFCFRQAGVVAFAHSEMTDRYDISSFQRFCNTEMELACLGSYFEQISTTGVSVEFAKIKQEICTKLASKEEAKCNQIAELEASRN